MAGKLGKFMLFTAAVAAGAGAAFCYLKKKDAINEALFDEDDDFDDFSDDFDEDLDFSQGYVHLSPDALHIETEDDTEDECIRDEAHNHTDDAEYAATTESRAIAEDESTESNRDNEYTENYDDTAEAVSCAETTDTDVCESEDIEECEADVVVSDANNAEYDVCADDSESDADNAECDVCADDAESDADNAECDVCADDAESDADNAECDVCADDAESDADDAECEA
ncbi:MAG: hypothetical protein IKL04_00360, partial [Lachnospiraceae bacterium]|nr:hypothetical protein [Lachnospiraceae bacterium]